MTPQDNRFSSFTLTAEEEILSCIFNELNLAHMKNVRAEAAEEKVNLKYDPLNPIAFAQREAELQGVITTLDTLINGHEEAQAAYLQLSIDSNSQS